MSEFNVSNLASLNANGLTVASFPQIKTALAKALMSIYGNDIDISSASADGQYVMSEALVLNTAYSVLGALAKQLSPSTASGAFLDVLAGFSRTSRHTSTFSEVTLEVTNLTSGSLTPRLLTCIDKNKNEWIWRNPELYDNSLESTWTPGETKALVFRAKTIGPVTALAGEIDTCTVQSFGINQPHDATPGESTETDASLRRRCLVTSAAGSDTVTDALRAELSLIGGVKNVYVLANSTGSDVTVCQYGTQIETVADHDVFIAMRYDDITNEDVIGDTIFGNLTPGVRATYNITGTVATGEQIVKEYPLGEGNFVTYVKWKRCAAIKPAVIIYYMAVQQLSDAQKAAIASNVIAYLNSQPIMSLVTGAGVCSAAISANIKSPVTGYNVFVPKSCTINGVSDFDLQTCYFNYESSDVQWHPGYLQIGGQA